MCIEALQVFLPICTLTCSDKTIDVLLTNSPSPVNWVKRMPLMGMADHDIVCIEYDITAKRIQQALQKIYLYKKADMGAWVVFMTI